MVVKKSIVTILSILIAGIVVGCGGSSAGNGGKGFDLSAYPKTENLTQEVKDSLAYMGNEERLAYDVYMNLYDYYQKSGVEIKQLYNISTSCLLYTSPSPRD